MDFLPQGFFGYHMSLEYFTFEKVKCFARIVSRSFSPDVCKAALPTVKQSFEALVVSGMVLVLVYLTGCNCSLCYCFSCPACCGGAVGSQRGSQ